MNKFTSIATIGLCLLPLTGCTVKTSAATGTQSPAAGKPATQGETGATTQKEQAAAKQQAQAKLVFQVHDAELAAPESIIYDSEEDVYLVSNVNGKPTDADGNGFISKVSPEGKVEDLKFIDGSKSGVTLDAPKGMAISGGVLYVADIKWIRLFDKKTGEPKGKLFAKGATFLNDMTTDPEGVVYVTDTGWKEGAKGFEDTGSDTIYKIDPKQVVAKAVVSDKKLGSPNGIATTKTGLWVVSDEGELYQLDGEEKKKVTKLEKGGLDGVIALDDGTFLISSWEAKAVYHGSPDKGFEPVVTEMTSPADIGWDTKRKLLLIPSMMESRLLAYQLSEDPKAIAAVAPAPGAEPQQAAAAPGKAKAQAQSGPKQKGKEAAKPAAPATPAKPAKPKKKGTPAEPAKPAKPAEPAKPAR